MGFSPNLLDLQYEIVYFPQNARDFILDSFNITYNSEKRAQARLGRLAPCLGLTLYFDSTDGTE